MFLRACRQPYIETHWDLRESTPGKFLGEMRTGALDILSEEAASAELLAPTPPFATPALVVMRFLGHALHETAAGVDIQEWLVQSVQKVVTVGREGGVPAPAPILDEPAAAPAAGMNFADAILESLAGELFEEGADGDDEVVEFLAAMASQDAPDPDAESDPDESDEPGEAPADDGVFAGEDVLHFEDGGDHVSPEASGAEVAAPRDDLEVVLERLQLRAEGAWPRRLWHVDEEAPLGKVYKVWGRAYKAECKRHPHCSLFVDVAWCDGSETAAVSFLYNWLAEGRTTTENQHWASRCRRLQEAKRKK